MSLKSINLNLAEKFKNRDYFQEFFYERARDDVANGIRDLREKRDLTQAAFAKVCEMQQSAVSRLEDENYSGWSFNTLRRVAGALDARLIVSFVPREDVIEEYKTQELLKRGLQTVDVGITLSGKDYFVAANENSGIYREDRGND